MLETHGIVMADHETDEASGLQVKLRSYQQEMLEESLRRNVIVAMDTGSGKTHVAIARILAELERCDPGKLVWFMTPSKALSLQQCDVLQQNLPAYQVRSLTGDDNVDKWTDSRLWDAYLFNVRVVVGTPAVLADALTHGFVHMSRLTLCVFDEAHRCIGDSPMNTIMRNFYHPRKANGESVPSILGLSASPVMNNKANSLAKIETNLDAVTTTPKQHRTTLEQYVHPPQFTSVIYQRERYSPQSTILHVLRKATVSYDLLTDPWVMELLSWTDSKAQKKLEKVYQSRKTYCAVQLRTLLNRADALGEVLGDSAAEWYVSTCIRKFLKSLQSETLVMPDITEKEKRHLATILSAVQSAAAMETTATSLADLQLSSKVQELVSVLTRHSSSSFRGIIFVEQRAAVVSLAHLVRSLPATSSRFSTGTFVGTSTNTNRQGNIADLVDLKEQLQGLAEFREGKRNLMIATNVLEEGIDISACNFVICFDPPKNLVSFVQRRGRARQVDSKYILFLAEDDLKTDPSKWQRLEHVMKQAYMDDEREPPSATEQEDEELMRAVKYHVDSTGALLTLENAKAHLYHFCAVSTLQTSKYIDARPEFETVDGPEGWIASVMLPAFVHPSIRSAKSSQTWKTEDLAIRDAAFTAYVALHEAGLLNDNLLPKVKDYGSTQDQEHVDQPSLVQVSDRTSSWTRLAEGLQSSSFTWHACLVSMRSSSGVQCAEEMWLPVPPPTIDDFQLHWNTDTKYQMSIQPLGKKCSTKGAMLLALERSTDLLLRSVHGSRMSPDHNDFLFLFALSDVTDLDAWLEANEGNYEATNLYTGTVKQDDWGLVRIKGQLGRAFFIQELLLATSVKMQSTPSLHEQNEIVVTSFPKRKDFLHPVHDADSINPAYTARQVLAASDCTVDRLPAKHAVFAAFVPSILHRLDITLLAQGLQTTILAQVELESTALIVEALSAPAAGETTDYNRLEYLGDSILKLCTELQVVSRYLLWPEAYLSTEKDRIVRNSTLAQAAIAAGLDSYILVKPFTGAKWQPPSVHEMLAAPRDKKREMSSKVLADVVEALIGAAFCDGGLPKAFACIRTLLPGEQWSEHHECFDRLLSSGSSYPVPDLSILEQLVGHHFDNPCLLVEAITHASFPSHHTGTSYERLEFLGDAVLDLIVVPKLFAHPRKLRHWELHRIHEALVNRHFLGYCCMSHAIGQEQYHIRPKSADARSSMQIVPTSRQYHLHDFLRAGSEVVKAKIASISRFENYQETITAALQQPDGGLYPWPELVAMQPDKFISDIIESVLGALYLDTHGELTICEAFLEKLGVLPAMRRMLDTSMETAHPRERVGILADKDKVEYAMSRMEREGGEKGKTFACVVKVGEREVARVEGRESREEAEVSAAHVAAAYLSSKGGAERAWRKRKLDTHHAIKPTHDSGAGEVDEGEGGIALGAEEKS